MTYIMDYDVKGFYGRRSAIDENFAPPEWDHHLDRLHVVRRYPPTPDFIARFPRRIQKYTGLRPPPPDFMAWWGHPILSRRARDVFEMIAGSQFDFVELDDSAWPKKVRGAGYSLLYLTTVIECIDVEKSDFVIAKNPGISPHLWDELPPRFELRDPLAEPKFYINATAADGHTIWCGKPFSSRGVIMISDALHDAWVAAGLGPMGYIKCIDV